MWNPEPCNNEDSCDPGATHFYPETGTQVDISNRTSGREVSTNNEVHVPRGIYVIGDHVNNESHEASIVIGGKLVWVNIDEMFAVGSYTRRTS